MKTVKALSKAVLLTSIWPLILFSSAFFYPAIITMPVDKATKKDYHPKSFWFHPWGKSVTHKGVDIFAPIGRKVLSATDGIVIGKGYNMRGGNFVIVLGPKWRSHYYAHLHSSSVQIGDVVFSGDRIGQVGDSGNAKGKPPHLHYAIVSLIPLPWRIDDSPQGWKKMYYLNPIEIIENKP